MKSLIHRIPLLVLVALSLAGCGGGRMPEMQKAKNVEVELRDLHREMTKIFAIYDLDFMDAGSRDHAQLVAKMEEDLQRCRELEVQLSDLEADIDLERLARQTSALEAILKLRLAPTEEERMRIRQENKELFDEFKGEKQ